MHRAPPKKGDCLANSSFVDYDTLASNIAAAMTMGSSYDCTMKAVHSNGSTAIPGRRIILFSIALLIASSARAAVIWNGPAITFTQIAGSGAVDQLTPAVGLTRASTQGLYNAVTETGYTHDFSPADTQWAYGELADYATLTYTDWEDWNGGNPPGMVGQDAVVHLVSDDIYLSLRFTSWPTGHQNPPGGFSYVRSTAAVSPPAFQSVTISNNSVILTWSATVGQACQFQYSTNLVSTNWFNLGNSITATNVTMNTTDTNAVRASARRFYRISAQ